MSEEAAFARVVRDGSPAVTQVRRGRFLVALALAAARRRALEIAPAEGGRAGGVHFHLPGPPESVQWPWLFMA